MHSCHLALRSLLAAPHECSCGQKLSASCCRSSVLSSWYYCRAVKPRGTLPVLEHRPLLGTSPACEGGTGSSPCAHTAAALDGKLPPGEELVRTCSVLSLQLAHSLLRDSSGLLPGALPLLRFSAMCSGFPRWGPWGSAASVPGRGTPPHSRQDVAEALGTEATQSCGVAARGAELCPAEPGLCLVPGHLRPLSRALGGRLGLSPSASPRCSS